VEAARAADVLESVATYADGLEWVVLVDDSPTPRDLAASCQVSGTKMAVLQNPRAGIGFRKTGGLCVADLVALQYVHDKTNADFMLKLDTDSLVIGPFEAQIRSLLAAHRDVGQFGVIGDTFGENRTGHIAALNHAWMTAALTMPETYAEVTEEHRTRFPPATAHGEELFDDFLVARALLRRALEHGYSMGEFCQGGGYVVARRLMERMSDTGAWNEPVRWRGLNIGEDVMMAIQTKAVGLSLQDVSQSGPKFAVQTGCVALSRQELVQAGYSVVHSIRGSMEDEFRAFFRARRISDGSCLAAEPRDAQDDERARCARVG
jgi:hypothetical protein